MTQAFVTEVNMKPTRVVVSGPGFSKKTLFVFGASPTEVVKYIGTHFGDGKTGNGEQTTEWGVSKPKRAYRRRTAVTATNQPVTA